MRYGLADCSSPMQSTQFLCRGGGQLKQSSWSRKAGPQFFGGDANLARWAVELGCFGRDSFKYSGALDTMPQRCGQRHVSYE